MIAHRLVNIALGAVPWSVRRHIKRVPGLADLQRVVVSATLDGKEFVHRTDAGPAKGVNFVVRLPEDKGIWTGAYEVEFATELARAVEPGTVTFDIGSWHGFFAGVMAAQGAEQVHVFEPLPVNVDRIRKLIRANPEKGIVLHPCAVGERDAEMDLLIMPETSMAKLEASPFQAERTSGEKVRVPVRSIDRMIAAGEAPPPALMKIDVEGAELMVLEGALDTLRSWRPKIFAEIHSAALLEACAALLDREGYEIERIDAESRATNTQDVFQIRAFAKK